MSQSAWVPSGIAAPPALLAARLPPGEVTERQWLVALGERVTALAQASGDRDLLISACQALGVTPPQEFGAAGEALVLKNASLRHYFRVAVSHGPPFPAMVHGLNPQVERLLKETDFSAWVLLALYVTGEDRADPWDIEGGGGC